MEEYLSAFKPKQPEPGLKGRVLAAARAAPKPALIDRLWNRRTWLGLAASLLGAVVLCALSARPISIPGMPAGSRAPQIGPATDAPTMIEMRRKMDEFLVRGRLP